MDFEWDDDKQLKVLHKHGIDFEDAIGIFEGFVAEQRSDRFGEARWTAIGPTGSGMIALVYTMRGEVRRVITARPARKYERREYHARQPEGSS